MAQTQTRTKDAPDVSVVALARDMQKYILEITPSEQKGAVDPVYVSNGDYTATIKRGRRVIVPECLVTALRDAITGVMDPVTRVIRDVPSYPFQAERYDGDLPVGTELDMRGKEVAR